MNETTERTRAAGKAVVLSLYEINAAANALANTCPIAARSHQRTAADRAYYKLVDAAREMRGPDVL